jgi:PAS domain S-box-containing protein
VSEVPRSTARSTSRSLGLAIYLQAIALVAAVFTAFFIGGARLPVSIEVLVSVTATACSAGLVLLLLAQVRTRLRQLLAAEAESRERAEHAAALLDVLFEKAPVGLAVVDPQLRYLRVNQRLAEIQGQPAQTHVGRTVGEANPSLAAALGRGFQAALDGQDPQHDELVGDSPAAPGPRDLVVSYYPIRVGGEVVAAGGMVLDVTEHKQVERELEEAIRVRDDFISVASHELKTPLTSLRLNLDVLLSAVSGPGPLTTEKLHRRLEIVDRVADRLQQLIEELLNITRVTSGHMALTLAQVDLAEVIDDVIARLGTQLADARCPVNATLQRPVLGRWDRLRLDQIVTNLVSNAIKYGAGRAIDISLSSNDQGAVLVVRDRGIGIATEDQSRIFQRFERAVSTRSYGGLGIGLWLVERIVGALGGQITVASQPGQGAVFSVLLPREGPAAYASQGTP